MLFIYSCSFYVNGVQQKGNTFSYSCNLFIKYYGHNLYGDCYIYQNISGFYIDMYTFGNMVFRLHEGGQKIKVFLQNDEYEYNFNDKFFSVDYIKFKKVLLSFLRDDNFINEKHYDYEIFSFVEDDNKKLVFKDLKNINSIEFTVKK